MMAKLRSMITHANQKIENINKRIEFVLILIISLGVVLGITLGLSTMTSGFHLVDDHEFLEWTYGVQMQGENIFSMIRNKVLGDFSWRYEPMYYTTRMLTCYLFGSNLLPYSLLKATEFFLSIMFLYYSGRQMGADKKYSLLFALVSVLGYQSPVWWKLGPQEGQCTMLFAAGFFCMLKWLHEGKKSFMVSSMLLFALMVNYKESYIILIPFLMLYVLYEELQKQGGAVTLKAVTEGIRNRLGYLIFLGVCFLVPVIVILTCVGTNNYGNVGLDSGASLGEYVDGLTRSLQGDLKWFKRFGILFGLILLTYYEELKKLWKEMLLTVAFLLPQFVIFGRSGIGERYVLPSAIGFAFFFVAVISKWKPLSRKRRAVYLLFILLLLGAHTRVTLREADYFRFRGESVTSMLESVREMASDDTKVLACFRPNEEGNLTINYWMKLHGFDQVYYYTEETGMINRECDINLFYAPEDYEPQSFEDMDIVVMYNRLDRHFVYDLSLDLTDFTEIPCGTLTIYVRNGSVPVIVQPKVEELRIHF